MEHVQDIKDKIVINGHEIKLTHLDKEFFPEAGFTKGDILGYYSRIGSAFKRYVKKRPMVMQRFPDGITGPGFFQKEVPVYYPTWIDRVPVEIKSRQNAENYIICTGTDTLLYLVNQAALTFHTWLSNIRKLNYPDRMIFDFDPQDIRFFKQARMAAMQLKNLLDEFKIHSFPLLTGSRGIHVIIPLKVHNIFNEVRSLARKIAEKLENRHPGSLTTELTKEKRQGRIFIDYLRNSYAQTSVAPYSVRTGKNAPVATPISWNDLKNDKLQPDSFNIETVFQFIKDNPSVWDGFETKTSSFEQISQILN